MFRKNTFIKCSYLKNSEILSLYIINIFQKQNSGYMVIKSTEEPFHPPGNPCLCSLLSTFVITFPPHLLFHIVLLAGMWGGEGWKRLPLILDFHMQWVCGLAMKANPASYSWLQHASTPSYLVNTLMKIHGKTLYFLRPVLILPSPNS